MKCQKIGQFDSKTQVILKIKVMQPKASALIRRICQLANYAIVKADALDCKIFKKEDAQLFRTVLKPPNFSLEVVK